MGVATIFAMPFLVSFIQAVLFLTGASDASELNQHELEQYESLARTPLAINNSGRHSLLASSLFSQYQVESILDYRSRNGDILSQGELAVVDGFTPAVAPYYALFLDFSPSGATLSATHAHGEAVGAIQAKMADDDYSFKWSGKFKTSLHARSGEYSLTAGAKSDWSQPVIKADSLMWKKGYAGAQDFAYGLSYSGNSQLATLVLGHFNARFGQGLGQWSGMVIDSYTTPSSLMRRPSGISPYTGWSPEYAMNGAAMALSLGRWSISSYADIGGLPDIGRKEKLRYGANAAWNHRHGEIGLTLGGDIRTMAASVDFQHSLRGGSVLCAELNYAADSLFMKPVATNPASGSVKAVGGARMALGQVDFGLRGYYSMYEHNLVSAVDWLGGRKRNHRIWSGTSLSYFPRAKGQTPAGAAQLKIQANYSATSGECWSFATRVNIKLRELTHFADTTAKYAKAWAMRKYELRQDIRWDNERFLASLRLNALYGESLALLAALEGGWRAKSFQSFAQLAFFRVDDWDDRLYLYQRDAPGAFNVPAMYGRGYMLSAYMRADLGRYVKLYLRMAWSSYPWARPSDTRKTDTAEARLQLCLNF